MAKILIIVGIVLIAFGLAWLAGERLGLSLVLWFFGR